MEVNPSNLCSQCDVDGQQKCTLYKQVKQRLDIKMQKNKNCPTCVVVNALVAIWCLLNISKDSNFLCQSYQLNQKFAILQRLQILSFNLIAFQ